MRFGIGYVKLFTVHLVLDVRCDFCQSGRFHRQGDDHAHHGVAFGERMLGQLEIRAFWVHDVPHRGLDREGQLLGVVIDDHDLTAPEGPEQTRAAAGVGDVNPPVQHAHPEPTVGVIAEAG